MESKPTDQRKALDDAFRATHGEPTGDGDFDWWARYHPFTAMLDAGAWLSAAEMLVRDDDEFRLERFHTGECEVELWPSGEDSDGYQFTAPSAALALLSAILAARGQERP